MVNPAKKRSLTTSAAALSWALNLGLWSTATVTEVYGLYALLFTLLAWMLLRYHRIYRMGDQKKAQWWLAAAAVASARRRAAEAPDRIARRRGAAPRQWRAH